MEISAQSLAHLFADLIYMLFLHVGFFSLSQNEIFMVCHCLVTFVPCKCEVLPIKLNFLLLFVRFLGQRRLCYDCLKSWRSTLPRVMFPPVCFTGRAHLWDLSVYTDMSPVFPNPRWGGKVKLTVAHARSLGSDHQAKFLALCRFPFYSALLYTCPGAYQTHVSVSQQTIGPVVINWTQKPRPTSGRQFLNSLWGSRAGGSSGSSSRDRASK